jgi:hypothetical protein
MAMNAWRSTVRSTGFLVLGAVVFALFSPPLYAEARPVYQLSYTLGQDALSPLDVFGGAERLRPGFHNDVQQQSRELSVGVRSTRVPSLTSPGFEDHAVQTSGGFIQRFGSSGFGYGVDLGLGLHSSTGDGMLELGGDPATGSSFVITDFSTGPTYESGNLRSRVRVGVRYPLLGEADTASSLYGHRADAARGTGYLSLDSRLRFSNQTEMSVSVFYDDHGVGASRNWLGESFDLQGGGAGSGQPVVGFEMGLNF